VLGFPRVELLTVRGVISAVPPELLP
jgi:hypothetical protein